MTEPRTTSTSQLDALMRATRAFSGIVAASLAQAGDQVTTQQLRVLVIVATHGTVKPSDVSDTLDVHPSSATRLCDKLVRRGWLDRAQDPDNRRQVTLRLTSAGWHVVTAVMEHRRQALARVLEALDPDDRDQVHRCLTLVSDALDEPDESDVRHHQNTTAWA